MDLRRSLLFVPGSDQERIAAAEASVADVVVVDLEDGVSPAYKDEARETAVETLTTWSGPTPLGVRINGVDTTRGIADVERLVAADVDPEFLVVPDVRGPGDVRIVAEAVAGTDIGLLPLIEQPSAVFEVDAIAHATSRIYGLLFAAIDFQMNMGMAVLGESDISVARYLVSLAASAAGVPAFDKPLLVVDDEELLAAEIARARALGYDGKLAVTTDQAAAINEGFLPSEAELAEARRVVDAFEAADAGLVEIDGTLVDKPVIDQLKDRIALVETAEAHDSD
jgi:citrate lyase beta subunit